MSIWLVCKAVLLAVMVLVTIPLVLFLFIPLWGGSCLLVVERDSWLAKVKQPFVQRVVCRFLA